MSSLTDDPDEPLAQDPDRVQGSLPGNPLARALRAWADWRMAQVPTAEQAAQGDVPIGLPSGMGAMGVGIVRGIGHPAFRMLQRVAPAEAEHLQRSPAIVRYANAPANEMAALGMDAATIPVGGTPGTEAAMQAQRIIQAGGLRQAGGFSGTKIPLSELQEMAETPGSSVQVYPSGQPIDPSNVIHEAAHSLRFARTGGATGLPTISAEKATSARIQAMKAGVPFAYPGLMTDPIHSALDALSRMRAGGV